MAETITKEQAKKDLANTLKKPRAEFEKSKETGLSPEEKKKSDDAKEKTKKDQVAADALAKRNKEIMEASEEDLAGDKFTDEERKRKPELFEKKAKAEEGKLSPDQKIEKIKKETQLRIDKISNELLQLKDKSSKEGDELRRQLAVEQEKSKALEKKVSGAPDADDIEAAVNKEEQERIEKFLKEDTELPREQRREMSKEELETWLLEDIGAAQTWLTRREMRRANDRLGTKTTKKQEKFVKNLMDKQAESTKRAWAKHPELDITKREAELKAEGKEPKEIHKILCEENKKHKVVSDLLVRFPRRYMAAENGPELLADDMEKVLNADPVKDEKQEQIDKLIKEVQELTGKIQQLETDDVGLSSNLGPERKEAVLSEAIKQFVKTAKETGLPQARIDAKVKEMRGEK